MPRWRADLVPRRSPQQLTQPLDAFVTRLPPTPSHGLNCLWTPKGGATNHELMARARANVRAEDIVCEFHGELSDPVEGIVYDRLAPGYCKTAAFKRGDIWSSMATASRTFSERIPMGLPKVE